jgi:hypothetical protein
VEENNSTIKITYKVEEDGSYNELRDYDGSFGNIQLLRTIVGIYNDVILGHHHQVNHIKEKDLLLLGGKIAKLLEQGETKNAN